MSHKLPSQQQSGIMRRALIDSFKKLDPRVQFRNPVMFVVYLGSILTTLIALGVVSSGGASLFTAIVSVWLWFTVLFANF
ncbi:potassium-transporting ATPase subunit B, partial [Klebsiella pneumoniae]